MGSGKDRKLECVLEDPSGRAPEPGPRADLNFTKLPTLCSPTWPRVLDPTQRWAGIVHVPGRPCAA